MGNELWIEWESVIRTQLKLQVTLSFDRHHEFMRMHGLDSCRHVVDLGTGNGHFLAKLAEQYPTLRFIGIDDKDHMIEEARSRKVCNADWIKVDARDESVQGRLGAADGILMRYFVLHMPDTRIAIPRMLERVRPGTRLWIFDLDPDHSVCEPAHPAFALFKNLVQTFCNDQSIRIRIGNELPPLLEKAGFQVDATVVEPFNNRIVDPALFQDYLLREATLYHHFVTTPHSDEKLREIRRFFTSVMKRQTHFVQYGMSMISAVKRPSARCPAFVNAP